jgi:hypothetical protein
VLLQLEQSIISNIEQIVSVTIKQTLSNELKLYEVKNTRPHRLGNRNEEGTPK